jgi:hypothetical protein
VLSLTRLDTVFAITDTLAEAVSTLDGTRS